LGHPYLYQIDILVGASSYTLSPLMSIQRLTLMNFRIEPRLVLWGGEHFVPWIEIGGRPPSLTQRAFSLGIKYEWFIRPWSLTFGMGFSYDKIIFPEQPSLSFSIVRGLASVAYQI
jgi:hypothetical protein